MFSEAIIKWLISVVTGILGALVVTCWSSIKEFFKFKKKKQETALLAGVNKDVNTLEHRMDHHEDEMEVELQAHDQLNAQKLIELEERLMAILNPMREALLSSHYQSLLEKCKYYVSAGVITADELDDLETDYEIYKSLGGNGHLTMWMTRVRQLKVI